jgi:hypothetical protein
MFLVQEKDNNFTGKLDLYVYVQAKVWQVVKTSFVQKFGFIERTTGFEILKIFHNQDQSVLNL